MKPDRPMISVVMTAYNEEKYIAEAIDSILNQTYPDFEFIIVNDGSTDRTEEIILSYKDPRIVYIKNTQNLKLIASLNKGLDAAKGKYVARMDSDDISMPDRFEKQVQFMENHPEIGISGAQLVVFGSEDGAMNYPLEHEDLLLRLFITSCYPNNLVMFRREIMEKHHLRFPEGYLHTEDFKFWTQWLQLTKGANLPDYLAKYRFHPASVSHLYKSVQRETRNRVRAEYLAEIFKLAEAEKQMATDMGSRDYSRKFAAVKFFLARNRELQVFPQAKLEKTVFYLWYMDSLENVALGDSLWLGFTRIFGVSVKGNLKYWEYIIKHTLKSRLGLLK
jgi:glycosyltransferase involved in cell wall biosynthesis